MELTGGNAKNVDAGDLAVAGDSSTHVHDAVHRSDPAPMFVVEAAHDLIELTRREHDWRELAERTAGMNVFYEPDVFLPAVRSFGASKRSIYLFVYRQATSGAAELVGFLPFEKAYEFQWPYVPRLSAWRHPYGFLNEPLIDLRFAEQAWLALARWLRSQQAWMPLIEIELFNADGANYDAFRAAGREDNWRICVVDHFERASLSCETGGWDMALNATISKPRRKEYARQRRRLAELGRLEFRTLGQADDVGIWLNRFLQLERSGWKGRVQTAILDDPAHVDYYCSVCRALFARGRLSMLGIYLDDKPIAMKCNYLSGRGCFTIKIAFDEAYAKFSPGVLLEFENVRNASSQPDLRWFDSCAVPRHPMIDKVWGGRRTIEHVLVSPATRAGNAILSAFELARMLKRKARRSIQLGKW